MSRYLAAVVAGLALLACPMVHAQESTAIAWGSNGWGQCDVPLASDGQPEIFTQVAGGGEHSFTYDDAGNLVSETDENGHTTTHEYDDNDRRVKTADPLGGDPISATQSVATHLVATQWVMT